MSDPAQPPARKKRRKTPWLSIGLGLLLVLGILWWWGGEKLMLQARGAIAEHYATKSREALSRKDWVVAGQNLARARSWLVNHPPVLRAYAEMLEATGSDNLSLLQVLRTLDSLQVATPRDRVQMARILMSLGYVDLARREYDKLPPDQRQTREGLELLAGIYQIEGRTNEAEKLLHQALALAPNDPDSRLRLAMIQSQDKFSQGQAKETLWEIASGTGTPALQALEFLAAKLPLDGTEADTLMRLVEAHPGHTPQTRYAALSARLRARPQDRESLLAAEVSRVQGKGMDVLSPALNWLLQENEPARVITLLPDKLYLKSGEFLHAYLLALSSQNRWSEIDQLLKTQRSLPVSDTFLQLWRARAADRLDAGMEYVRRHLAAAFASTQFGQNDATGQMTAELAEQTNQWDLASQYYEALAEKHPLKQIPMLEKVYEMAMRDRNTTSVLAAARKLAQLLPDNQIYAQRVQYLELVSGDSIELTLRTLDQPGLVTPPLIRALAAYRLGDATGLRKHLQGPATTADLPPGPRAVHAGLLALTGQSGPAYQLAETIPAMLLLPEEIRFLRKAL